MNRKGKYRAAFILPIPNEKILTDAGWEFHCANRLPRSAEEFLLGALKLGLSEKYSGMADYESDVLKASVILDDAGEIESVYLQLYGIAAEDLLSLFKASPLSSRAELFLPPVE